MSVLVHQLSKSFAGFAASSDIELDVPEGQMLVLLGASGCGKTTTMRCIAGLETPDSGTIEVGGRTVFDASRHVDMPVNQRRIGMVFQSYAIWPHMTVFQNVAFPLRMERLDGAETRHRVLDMLQLVGLDGFAERSASALSGGQMQRVALARSLVMRPTLLLFDEPLSNVDARLRDQLRVLLRELQMRFGITGIYVTHDQAEAFAIADQIAVMAGGRVLQIADPATLYRRPATSAIAAFIGYANIFAARLIEAVADGCLVELEASACRLRARTSPPKPGAAFDLCIRPDAVRLLPPDGAGGPNALQGEIVMVSFMGSQNQVRVRVADGTVWEVTDPMIFANPTVGMPVMLQVDPDQILLLPRG